MIPIDLIKAKAVILLVKPTSILNESELSYRWCCPRRNFSKALSDFFFPFSKKVYLSQKLFESFKCKFNIFKIHGILGNQLKFINWKGVQNFKRFPLFFAKNSLKETPHFLGRFTLFAVYELNKHFKVYSLLHKIVNLFDFN